jgi:hypothetical protein
MRSRKASATRKTLAQCSHTSASARRRTAHEYGAGCGDETRTPRIALALDIPLFATGYRRS